LLSEPLPLDVEDEELTAAGAELVVEDEDDERGWGKRGNGTVPSRPLPSWEAYFSAAAEVLLYSPHVRVDYAPFLACGVGSPQSLRRFFDTLYFETVPEALKLVTLNDSTRPLACLRSLAYVPPGGTAPLRRPSARRKVPVRSAPVDRYLKARGSQPPRTWVSGLAEQVRAAGAEEEVAAARAWYLSSVEALLSDPKEGDTEGDYFAAYLRACHREIYEDIDRSDPEELRRLDFAKSLKHPKSKKHRHNLKSIRIPNVDVAFKEFGRFDPEKRVTNARERVLGQILVDSFNLRLVDLAIILTVVKIVLAAAPGEPVVIVFYGGEDHAAHVAKFWGQRCFNYSGLPKNGFIGKRQWEEDEPRGLTFPSYLHDFSELFPVP